MYFSMCVCLCTHEFYVYLKGIVELLFFSWNVFLYRKSTFSFVLVAFPLFSYHQFCTQNILRYAVSKILPLS